MRNYGNGVQVSVDRVLRVRLLCGKCSVVHQRLARDVGRNTYTTWKGQVEPPP